VKIRAATPDDAAAVAEIYAPYVTESAVSFETEAPDAGEIGARMAACADRYPWLVGEDVNGAVLGYAYATAFRPRPAYRYAVETSVYLRQGTLGRGLGRRLYEPLLALLESQGYAQAIAAVTLPNDASVRLHEALGFTPAGIYRQVGYKRGEWLDVGLWQRGLAPATNPPPQPRLLSEVQQEPQEEPTGRSR
jgi:L-amino acid N-acyltransferase YncA